MGLPSLFRPEQKDEMSANFLPVKMDAIREKIMIRLLQIHPWESATGNFIPSREGGFGECLLSL
jgi:hypothetical protein